MRKVLSAFAAAILLLSCAVGSRGAEARELTILSYNIHHGEGLDGKIDLERIAKIISSSKADLVALQEVDRNTKRSGGVDQARELARLTALHHIFGRAIDYEGGEYGQAILARWPISSSKVHNLPQKPGREQRIVLVANLDSPIAGFQFATTHLDHQVETIRIDQARELNSLFATNQASASVLAGDFNAVPQSEPMKILLEAWADSGASNAVPTIPAEKPSKRIDYILFRPKSTWRVVRCEVLNEPVASDHRPVLSHLQLSNRE